MNVNDISCLVDYETREDCIDYAASKIEDGMICVELGSYLGGSIARFAEIIKNRNIKCSIYAIDNWKCENISNESVRWSNLSSHGEIYDKYVSNIKECGLSKIVQTIVGDTADIASQFKDKSVNYIFFDANHGYGGVLAELKAWKPKLADRCYAFIHDWPSQGIQDATRDVFQINKIARGGSSAIIMDTL
jgi:cephalosporin hydroxylase